MMTPALLVLLEPSLWLAPELGCAATHLDLILDLLQLLFELIQLLISVRLQQSSSSSCGRLSQDGANC
jgi:hypothetical protein